MIWAGKWILYPTFGNFGGENDDSPVNLGDFQIGFGFSEGDGMSKLIKQLGKWQGQVIPQ